MAVLCRGCGISTVYPTWVEGRGHLCPSCATDSLDAAWADAEAALPANHGGLRVESKGGWGRIDGWLAYTYAAREPTVTGVGDTPAEALRSLAAQLRERAG